MMFLAQCLTYRIFSINVSGYYSCYCCGHSSQELLLWALYLPYKAFQDEAQFGISSHAPAASLPNTITNQSGCWLSGLSGYLVYLSPTLQEALLLDRNHLIQSYHHLRVFCVCAYSLSHVWLCDPLHCSPQSSSVQGDSTGKNTALWCHTLLQGIFPTQGSNPGLPHCRQILYPLSHQGSPTVLYMHAKIYLPRISFTIFSTWKNPTYSSETMITFNVSPSQLSQDNFLHTLTIIFATL